MSDDESDNPFSTSATVLPNPLKPRSIDSDVSDVSDVSDHPFSISSKGSQSTSTSTSTSVYKIEEILKMSPKQYYNKYYYPELDNDIGEGEFEIPESYDDMNMPDKPVYYTQNFYTIFLEFIERHIITTMDTLIILNKLHKYVNRVLWNPHGISQKTKNKSGHVKKIEINEIIPKLRTNPLAHISPYYKSTLLHYVELFFIYSVPEWNSNDIITKVGFNSFMKNSTIMIRINCHGEYIGEKPQIKETHNSLVLMKKYAVPYEATRVVVRPPDINNEIHKYYSENNQEHDKIMSLEEMKTFIDVVTEDFEDGKYNQTKYYVGMSEMPMCEKPEMDLTYLQSMQEKSTKHKESLQKYKISLNKYKKNLCRDAENYETIQKNIRTVKSKMKRANKKITDISTKYLCALNPTDVIDMSVNINYVSRFVTRMTDYVYKSYIIERDADAANGFSGIYNMKSGNNLMKNSELIDFVLDDLGIDENSHEYDEYIFENQKGVTTLMKITNEQLINFLSYKGYAVIQLLDESCETMEHPSSNIQEMVRRSHAMASVGFGKRSRKQNRKKSHKYSRKNKKR